MGEETQWLTIHDPATCTRRGLCPVTNSSGQNYSLYFEQHGTGPRKVVFIMGLVQRAGSSPDPVTERATFYRLQVSCNSWAVQVAHFGRLPQYSILVFDNRGVGNSDTPRGPYSFVPSILMALDWG